MALPEMGAYLKTIREARKISQQQLADQVDVSARQVRAWEHGAADPAASTLAAMILILRASPDDVIELLNATDATPALARQRAKDWMEQQQVEELRQILEEDERESAGEYQELVGIIAGLRHDPRKYERLLGFATALLQS